MKKDILKELLITKYENFLSKYGESEAYNKIVKYYNDGDISSVIDQKTFNSLFTKPKSYEVEESVEFNEFGDIIHGSEFTDFDERGISLDQIDSFGWLDDIELRNELLNENLFRNKVRPNLGQMEDYVKDQIEEHSLHVLGRSNNPNDWSKSQQNKTGLVYGMVQSGKTANMISLIGLARAAGYRLFILLTGDKDSLRKQTQIRLNKAFGLDPQGRGSFSIRSLTTEYQDYNHASNPTDNPFQIWNIQESTKGNSLIICLKKNISAIDKLNEDIEYIIKQSNENYPFYKGFSFKDDFKTLILDDEADYASQDINPNRGGSSIHNGLAKLRENIPLNSYVAYTATPQACIAADPTKSIGYPKDFIWLLDPYRDEKGLTTSYLGLEEIFVENKEFSLQPLSDDAWPFVNKEEGERRGIFNPSTGELIESILRDVELEVINDLKIEAEAKNIDRFEEYIRAIIDFITGCSIRWYEHYIDCKKMGFFKDKKPSLEDIENISKHNFSPFPYHAMMFNLAYTKETHLKLADLIDLIWKNFLIEAWRDNKKNKWENEDNPFYKFYNYQLSKSSRYNKKIPNVLELEYFIDIAIKITEKQIFDSDKYVYVLNSTDEGSTLDYTNPIQNERTKKAAIFIGGNILSRGLTIENLSVSFFARSQVLSLGDTNLQMCRWFGHKRKSIDLISVYMQRPTISLFEDITNADRELRQQFRFYIERNIPMENVILQLFNSDLFKVTSPTKAKNLRKTKFQSFSGTRSLLLDPFGQSSDFINNNSILENYLSDINSDPIFMHNRGWVYDNINKEEFLYFFNQLNIKATATNVNPSIYKKYIDKWKALGPLPKFNLAIIGKDKNFIDEYKNRKRKLRKASLTSINDIKKNTMNQLEPFMGGKPGGNNRKKNYIGDHFLDKDIIFHKENFDKRNLRRSLIDGILFIFYKLEPNYIGEYKIDGNKEKIFFEQGDKGFIDTNEPLITFAIATPINGPVYSVYENKFIFFEPPESNVS